MADPRELPLNEIEAITNGFADANCIGEAFFGKIYKGQLPCEGGPLDVSVRRLDYGFHLQEMAFEKEILILSRHKHENIVSFVGFCYHENKEMLIINERVARGSLSRQLSDPNLTWMRRLKISVGAVRALSYLHSVGVIHHDINSNTILLDENWEAKLSGFEYSMTIPATNIDLVYEKLRIGTYKSDVFSIGIVLFELLCGMEAFTSKDNNSFQASLAIFHYKNGKLHELVHSDLFSQMDLLSFKIFSETAYNCLKNQKEAPTMKEVLKRLERALEVQRRHDNNEHSTVAVERTIPDHLKLKLKSLEHMRIPLADIEVALSKGHIVSSGGYGSVYIAELEHVDKAYCKTLERENAHEVSKKRSKVAIKRIIDTEDKIAERGFFAEIEMLTSCKHSNIITLLGFCDEGDKLILIYEHASNSSLSDYIQKTSNIKNDCWAQRVKICLDAAKGLWFLHTTEGDRPEIVHRDIKSSNILLDENFKAKIGDFGLSVFLSVNKDREFSRITAYTPGYVDPQYYKYSELKKEIDVYSFGVVLFEILTGTLAYFPEYSQNNYTGLARLAKRHFEMKTIKEVMDRKIENEITETLFTSVKGPNQESLDTFAEIAYKCLSEAQAYRPTMEVVVKELEKALSFQETRKDIYQVSLDDIRRATDNFSDENCINKIDGFWAVYRGEVSPANGCTTSFDVKRLFSKFYFYEIETELKVLMEHKHKNVVGLLGYCVEEDERIIVYEHALNGTLNLHLDNTSLTWGKRLKICIDIATGLEFLHGGFIKGEVVIHRDIRSENIRLDGDMRAKIADFGISIVRSKSQETVFFTKRASGTPTYDDPEYGRTWLLSKECDIYSFGIVLFEILLQRLAYSFDNYEEGNHLGPLIERLYKEGKLDGMVFEGKNEHIVPQSLIIFRRIAIQCLREKREERPTATEVIIQLKQALEIQEKGMDIVKISFEDIKNATDNFKNYIGGGANWNVYKGQLSHANGQKIIAAKRFVGRPGEGDPAFYQELEVLFKFKHQNVIGLVGYCDEMDERIIVYEYASNGSLDASLDNISLTWMKRLDICIGIASGLEFLHGSVLRREAVIHRDFKSSNILLSQDWEAKITDFGLSLVSPNNQEIDYVTNINIAGSESYIDPAYRNTGRLSKASDIYTFGVVLFEILCGRLANSTTKSKEKLLHSVWFWFSKFKNSQQYLGPLAKSYYEQRKLDELVFEGIKEQILPRSLSTFASVACRCILDDPDQRPTANVVLEQLKEAKELHVDYEMWEPKLPSDYKDLIQQARTSGFCDNKKRKDLYDMLCEGILIQNGKVWFSLDSNNKRNEMISATLFTYQNKSSQMWRHIRKSRFQRVPLIMDVSNLRIQAKIKAQFLDPNAIYGVYLVFAFFEQNKISSKPKYVNLKYKKDNETLHAYFATWRKDKWMMIELYRFQNDKDDGDFEVLLESFSRSYCGSSAIYIEGIEFRAIDNVTHEEIQKSNSDTGLQQFPIENVKMFKISINSDKFFQTSEMNGKKHIMLSAKGLFNSSNVKLFKVKPSEQSRFQEVIEVLSQQVIHINCDIASERLSLNTDYGCYLVFKFSEKCHGLHCPVKVKCMHRPVKVEGLPHQRHKETKDLYFRTPKIWNIHDNNEVPKQREDGWMEVNVWKFNSKNQLRNDWIPLNLKLISYEGTMSGLILDGLEVRPV